MVSPNGEKPLAALASVMLAPLPPKSHSTITPCVGSPGLARNAVSAAVASDTTGSLPRRFLRRMSTTDGRQCAGTVTATSDTGMPVGDRLGHRAERFGEQFFGPILRPVRCDQRHRIANALDEPGEALAVQRQLCGMDHGGLPIAGAGEVRRADRQAE